MNKDQFEVYEIVKKLIKVDEEILQALSPVERDFILMLKGKKRNN